MTTLEVDFDQEAWWKVFHHQSSDNNTPQAAGVDNGAFADLAEKTLERLGRFHHECVGCFYDKSIDDKDFFQVCCLFWTEHFLHGSSATSNKESTSIGPGSPKELFEALKATFLNIYQQSDMSMTQWFLPSPNSISVVQEQLDRSMMNSDKQDVYFLSLLMKFWDELFDASIATSFAEGNDEHQRPNKKRRLQSISRFVDRFSSKATCSLPVAILLLSVMKRRCQTWDQLYCWSKGLPEAFPTFSSSTIQSALALVGLNCVCQGENIEGLAIDGLFEMYFISSPSSVCLSTLQTLQEAVGLTLYQLRAVLCKQLLETVISSESTDEAEKNDAIAACVACMRCHDPVSYLDDLSNTTKRSWNSLSIPLAVPEDVVASDFPVLTHLKVWLLVSKANDASILLRHIESCDALAEAVKERARLILWQYLLEEGELFLDGNTEIYGYDDKQAFLYERMTWKISKTAFDTMISVYEAVADSAACQSNATVEEKQYVILACQQTVLRLFIQTHGLGDETVSNFLKTTEWPVDLAGQVGTRNLSHWCALFLENTIPVPSSLIRAEKPTDRLSRDKSPHRYLDLQGRFRILKPALPAPPSEDSMAKGIGSTALLEVETHSHTMVAEPTSTTAGDSAIEDDQNYLDVENVQEAQAEPVNVDENVESERDSDAAEEVIEETREEHLDEVQVREEIEYLETSEDAGGSETSEEEVPESEQLHIDESEEELEVYGEGDLESGSDHTDISDDDDEPNIDEDEAQESEEESEEQPFMQAPHDEDNHIELDDSESDSGNDDTDEAKEIEVLDGNSDDDDDGDEEQHGSVAGTEGADDEMIDSISEGIDVEDDTNNPQPLQDTVESSGPEGKDASEATDDENERTLPIEKADTEDAGVDEHFGATTDEEGENMRANRAADASRRADMKRTGYTSQADHDGYEAEDTHDGYTEEEVSEAIHTEDEEEERNKSSAIGLLEAEKAPDDILPLSAAEKEAHHSSDDMDMADEHTEQEDLGAESSELEDAVEGTPVGSARPAMHPSSSTQPEGASTLVQYAQTAQHHHDWSHKSKEKVSYDDKAEPEFPTKDSDKYETFDADDENDATEGSQNVETEEEMVPHEEPERDLEAHPDEVVDDGSHVGGEGSQSVETEEEMVPHEEPDRDLEDHPDEVVDDGSHVGSDVPPEETDGNEKELQRDIPPEDEGDGAAFIPSMEEPETAESPKLASATTKEIENDVSEYQNPGMDVDEKDEADVSFMSDKADDSGNIGVDVSNVPIDEDHFGEPMEMAQETVVAVAQEKFLEPDEAVEMGSVAPEDDDQEGESIGMDQPETVMAGAQVERLEPNEAVEMESVAPGDDDQEGEPIEMDQPEKVMAGAQVEGLEPNEEAEMESGVETPDAAGKGENQPKMTEGNLEGKEDSGVEESSELEPKESQPTRDDESMESKANDVEGKDAGDEDPFILEARDQQPPNDEVDEVGPGESIENPPKAEEDEAGHQPRPVFKQKDIVTALDKYLDKPEPARITKVNKDKDGNVTYNIRFLMSNTLRKNIDPGNIFPYNQDDTGGDDDVSSVGMNDEASRQSEASPAHGTPRRTSRRPRVLPESPSVPRSIGMVTNQAEEETTSVASTPSRTRRAARSTTSSSVDHKGGLSPIPETPASGRGGRASMPKKDLVAEKQASISMAQNMEPPASPLRRSNRSRQRSKKFDDDSSIDASEARAEPTKASETADKEEQVKPIVAKKQRAKTKKSAEKSEESEEGMLPAPPSTRKSARSRGKKDGEDSVASSTASVARATRSRARKSGNDDDQSVSSRVSTRSTRSSTRRGQK